MMATAGRNMLRCLCIFTLNRSYLMELLFTLSGDNVNNLRHSIIMMPIIMKIYLSTFIIIEENMWTSFLHANKFCTAQYWQDLF
jgi:hypothetical protein